MKLKLLAVAGLTVLAACFVGGCNLDKNHNRHHWMSLKKNIRDFHEQTDYYILDYNKFDPWSN